MDDRPVAVGRSIRRAIAGGLRGLTIRRSWSRSESVDAGRVPHASATAERLKVRCYRCNQLLAVAPGKAGTVVACPKCKAELLIPRPEPQPTADEPADPSVAALKSETFPALRP